MRALFAGSRRWLALGFLFVAVSAFAQAAAPDASIAAEFNQLTAALVDRNYDRFLADGTDHAKANFTKPLFEAVCDQIGARLKEGFDAVYLTQLKQQGCEVYVWKITLKDGGDDFLIKLAMENGKVAGLRIQ